MNLRNISSEAQGWSNGAMCPALRIITSVRFCTCLTKPDTGGGPILIEAGMEFSMSIASPGPAGKERRFRYFFRTLFLGESWVLTLPEGGGGNGALQALRFVAFHCLAPDQGRL